MGRSNLCLCHVYRMQLEQLLKSLQCWALQEHHGVLRWVTRWGYLVLLSILFDQRVIAWFCKARHLEIVLEAQWTCGGWCDPWHDIPTCCDRSNDNIAASAGGGQRCSVQGEHGGTLQFNPMCLLLGCRYDTPRNWLKTLHDSVAGWQVAGPVMVSRLQGWLVQHVLGTNVPSVRQSQKLKIEWKWMKMTQGKLIFKLPISFSTPAEKKLAVCLLVGIRAILCTSLGFSRCLDGRCQS